MYIFFISYTAQSLFQAFKKCAVMVNDLKQWLDKIYLCTIEYYSIINSRWSYDKTVFFDNFPTIKSAKDRERARLMSAMKIKTININFLCTPVFYSISFKNIGFVKKACSMMLNTLSRVQWLRAESAMIQLKECSITDKHSDSLRIGKCFFCSLQAFVQYERA